VISLSLSLSLSFVLPDIAPVLEGAVQHIASRRFEIGGVDLTKLLAQELSKSNLLVNLNASDAEMLKVKYSCCAEDELAYEKTQRSSDTEEHTLPDGQVCFCVLF
jgi:actin-related protein 7